MSAVARTTQILVANPARSAPSILLIKSLVMPRCRNNSQPRAVPQGEDHCVPEHQLKSGHGVQMARKSKIKEMPVFYK